MNPFPHKLHTVTESGQSPHATLVNQICPQATPRAPSMIRKNIVLLFFEFEE